MPNEIHGFRSRADRKEKNKGLVPFTTAQIESGKLTSIQEHSLISNYKNSTTDTTVNPPKRVAVPLQAEGGAPLDGFYFKFEDGIREFLQREEFVGFYLGIGEDIASSSHTLVLYGVTNDENALVLHKDNNEMYDFCDPCPPRCQS